MSLEKLFVVFFGFCIGTTIWLQLPVGNGNLYGYIGNGICITAAVIWIGLKVSRISENLKKIEEHLRRSKPDPQ